MNGPAVISIVGKSNSGKTTLIEKLIPCLKKRGLRVGTVKHHAHPGLEFDKPGKDTWRHAQAGADAVALISPGKMFLVRRTEGEQPLQAVTVVLGDLDLVLTEGGYNWPTTAKIEVIRQDLCREVISSPSELVALVTDAEMEQPVPQFGSDEVEKLADFLQRFVGRQRPCV